MKSSTAALLLASIGSLTSASPVKSRQTTEPSAFTIIAARSGSPIHLQTVQASDRAFWIGKETTTYCPPEVDAEGSCPPGTQTVFEGGESTLSLDVSVPGGQRVYVEPTGALGFTQAHSSVSPAGSVFEGFSINQGPSFGSLGFSGLGATGFLACAASSSSPFPYKIFADVAGLKDADTPSGSVNDCIGFDALTEEYTGEGAAAWQYI